MRATCPSSKKGPRRKEGHKKVNFFNQNRNYRRTDDGRTKKIRTKIFSAEKIFGQKNFRPKNFSAEKFFGRKFFRTKKIGGKARGQGTAAAEARHG